MEKPRGFDEAMLAFDEANSKDPNTEIADGVSHSRELLYARRLSDWVMRLNPEASFKLQLAARCQHICRWTIPRDSHPKGRAGYLKWRAALKKFHARKAGELMAQAGCEAGLMAWVKSCVLKVNFPNDPDCCTIEDALCLVFLQYQFQGLAAKTPADTMVSILQKTWSKMSGQAREEAMRLKYGAAEQGLLNRALSAA